MDSYEDRKSAVELYIQYLRDAAATIQALGSPSQLLAPPQGHNPGAIAVLSSRPL